MPIRSLYELTDPRQFFAEPATPRQRQYEALRAYFVERLASAEAARRFGYSPGAFRVLCHTFRRGELPDFFTTAHPGPREQPKKSAAQKQIVALRKRNYSVYEISQALKEQGTPLSVALAAKLPGSRMIPAAHALRAALALKAPLRCARFWPQRGSHPCRAGSTRSVPAGSAPAPRRSPMCWQ